MAVPTHSKSPKSLFYFNFIPTSANIIYQSFLCKITDFHCSTTFCCYPLTFLCEFMQRAERMDLSLLSVHSRHWDGGHQGHRQVSLSSARPSVLGCWGLLHRLVEVGLLFTFKTLYCLHKKSYGLWHEEEGGQWAKECFPTGPTPKFLDQKHPLKTIEQGREHSSTGKQVESSNNMAAI